VIGARIIVFPVRDSSLFLVTFRETDVSRGDPVEKAAAVRAEVGTGGRGTAAAAVLEEKLFVALRASESVHVPFSCL
jgi:hypothetical protein